MQAHRIETERLVLRPFTLEDAPAVQRLAGEREVAQFTARIPHPYPEGAAAAWIKGQIEADDGTFAIERRADQQVIGAIGYEHDAGARRAAIGYWIGKPYWGQGYATEALAALTDHAFALLDVDELEAVAVPENRASIRVLEKTGFGYAGVRREPAPARGGDVGVQVRRLTRVRRQELKAPPPLSTVLVAAVALVDIDGRVLIAQRPEGKSMAGLWEFPGGKMHDGESPEAALIRELREELAIDVKESCLAPFTFASHRYETFHLLMPLYLCRRWDGIVTPLEGQAIKWVRPAKLADYPMPPADIPLVAMLRDFL